MTLRGTKYVLLTFDVEDWFQVENFKSYIEFSTWNSFELRVEKNTEKILDLLDSFSFKPKATFFILGWIAKRLPGLVRNIRKRGHEIASHGVDHDLCTHLSKNDLIRDLADSRHLLEDIAGEAVHGYRAPSFAINNMILPAVQQAGYTYDASFNSFSAHGRYGRIDLSGALKLGSVYQIVPGFFELPVSNLRLFGKIFPLGGGGYFRLIPFLFFKQGMKSVLKKNSTFIFYAHPWEFDPGQPRVEHVAPSLKFRHYINLNQTDAKLKNLISSFSGCQFITCSDYINKLTCRYKLTKKKDFVS